MSNHAVEVVPVELERHPNADALSIVRVRGFTVCTRTADWAPGDLGAYVPPDSVVDSSRPEFAFLKGHERIRVKRLRGIVSMGLLVKAPSGARPGDDVAEALGVKHYEPPLALSTGGEAEGGPPLYAPCFDVENLRRHPDILAPGEEVEVTEKIHGANGRFVFWGGRLWAGSRTEWKRPGAEKPPIWWAALDADPEFRDWLAEHPGMVVYAEVYGQVQDLKYGGGLHLAAFDILSGHSGEWFPAGHPIGEGLPWVPRIARMPFDRAAVETLAEGFSKVPGADHVREGCVVRPVVERQHPEIGRVILKVVGNGYMER